MNKVWRIFTMEMKALFSNVVTVIITIGLALMPSLFTWYNVLSCWDVFENTNQLTVAVASDDEGYKSELFPLKVNVGEQVTSSLRANDQINWVITTSEDAIEGTRAGRYYAAVVIPKGFSRAMLTFYQDEGEQAPLVYYTNEKINAIAPKITSQGADGVSYQVNKVFAECMADIALNIAQSMSQQLDTAEAQGRIAALATRVDTMGDRVDQTAQALRLYASLASSSQAVLDGVSGLVGKAKDSSEDLTDAIQEGLGRAQTMVGSLNGVLDSLEAAIDATIAAIDELPDIEPPADGLPDAQETAAALREQAASLDVQIQQYQSMRDALAAQDAEGNAAAIAALDESIARMEALKQSLLETADAIEAGNVPVDPGLIHDYAQEAKRALEDLKGVIESDMRPKVQQICDDMAGLQAQALVLSASLTESLDALEQGLGTAEGGMGDASASLNSLVGQLDQASAKLHGLAGSIREALSSNDMGQIRDLLGSNLDVLSSALSAPVGIERHSIYEVDNFGSSMMPLYATIGMFVGALLIMVGMKPRSSARVLRQVEELGPVKPRHEFFGHFGICAFVSLAQSTILALGSMLFLQVQVVHPLLFMMCYWVSSMVFTFFIYSLVVAFANLGKAMAVILLIVQVTGCNGSFPLQLLPDFVQTISPFLPATHVVAAMREAMFGAYGTVFAEQMGLVAFWILPALLLGLVLRKPFAKFMTWYLEKVESSKLMA